MRSLSSGAYSSPTTMRPAGRPGRCCAPAAGGDHRRIRPASPPRRRSPRAGGRGQGAEEGDPEAQLGVGILYLRGYGVPTDYVEAAKWLRLAADRREQKQSDEAAQRKAWANRQNLAAA